MKPRRIPRRRPAVIARQHTPPRMRRPLGPGLTRVLAYCRPGFERETALEMETQATAFGIHGTTLAAAHSGLVFFQPQDPGRLSDLYRALPLARLVFPRQVLLAGEPLTLDSRDPVPQLLEALRQIAPGYGGLWLESPDLDAAKQRLGALKGLADRLEGTMRPSGLLTDAGRGRRVPRLHLVSVGVGQVLLGISYPGPSSSPWPMGIPRLRAPPGAPSRSGLKLEEALHHFLPGAERSRGLRPGMLAVDLGAAPGGWTLVLARHGLRVLAVDNGQLDAKVLATGLVEHALADGFRYRPPERVDWLACDIVAPPQRIAWLAAQWLAAGWTTRALFNLKLPMKRRAEALDQCRLVIRQVLTRTRVSYHLTLKHLYHDREEVTAYLRRAPSSSSS